MSLLPQPSASRLPGRALSDLSESESNARMAMPPPPSTNATAGLKRQGSNLPEPAVKRKTLAERAGETVRPPAFLPRPASAASQSSSNAGTLYRSNSNASSLSRSTSVSSRHTSSASYSGSLHSGIKPPSSIRGSSSTNRPKSSYGIDKQLGAASKPTRSLADLHASHEAQANKSKDPFFSHIKAPRSMNDLKSQSGFSLQKMRSFAGLRSTSPRRLPSVVVRMRDKNRDVSLSTQLNQLSLNDFPDNCPEPKTPRKSQSPSKIPRASPAHNGLLCPTPAPVPLYDSRKMSPSKAKKYLTPNANIELFDTEEQYNNFKRMFEDYKQMHQDAIAKIDSEREQNNLYREKMTQLDSERSQQTDNIIELKTEKSTLQYQLESLESSMQQLKREHELKLEEIRKEHRAVIEEIRREHREELDRLRTDHRDELKEAKSRHQQELDSERSQKTEALSQVSTQGALQQQRHLLDLEKKEAEVSSVKVALERAESDLDRERQANDDLRETLRSAGDNATTMEATRQALQAKIAYLESDSKSQSEAYAEMEKRMNEAIAKSDTIEEKLRKEETIRRRLHNQVQELKGNIRVFCRVRPTLNTDEEMAKMKFPDTEESTEIELRGLEEKNSLGKDTTKTHPFTFDRVFDPAQSNSEVFQEISQLIQSALDGYNVCIFAYGQTGSGKTYTMSSEDGMIPKALRQIYSTSKELEGRGWKYAMHGSFVEVYNEELRDLLSDEKDTPKKHEIHHDMDTQETTVTNLTNLGLENEDQVEAILSQAMSRRSVAATKSNEHSSRSHSVFILKLVGRNSITGEQSKGTLNLVDLAGSERIKNAETSGQRLKETQSINKSLSCLGDVIGALGQGQAAADPRASVGNGRESFSTAHIPYRNSKLTYLLQLSLGGNCKTLMFVMVAPEKKCLGETITSLKFADKVSRTKVGVAKKTK